MKAILSRWKSLKTFYKIVILTTLLVALFLLFLPLMLKKTIEYALVQQGAESAQVEKVIVNPFSGRLELFNVTVSTEQKQQLNLGHLKVNLAWLDLLQKHINLQTLEVLDTTLFLVYHPNEYVRVGGITFPLNSKQPVTTPEILEEEHALWGLGVQNLVLQNTTLNLKTPEIDKTIQFDKVSVSKAVNWKPETYSKLGFQIQDGDGVLTGDLETKFFSDMQIIKGQVQINDFDLHPYQGYMPKTWEVVSGIVSGELDVELRNHFGEIDVQQTGKIGIRDFNLQQQGLKIVSKAIDWDGKLSFENHKQDYVLGADGQWQLAQFVLTQPQQTVQLDDLKWLGQVKVKQSAKNISVETQNQLMVSQPRLNKENLTAAVKTLFWKGPLVYTEANAKMSEKTPRIELADTQLALQKMSVDLAEMHVSSDLIQWQGNINVQPDAQAPASLIGQIGSTNVIVTNAALKNTLLRLAQFKSNMQFTSPQTFQFQKMSLTGVGIGQSAANDSPFLKIGGLDVSTLVIDNTERRDKTQLGKVTVHNIDTHLTLNKQHEFEEIQGLMKAMNMNIAASKDNATTDTTAASAEAASSEPKQSVLKLEQLSLKGQNKVVFETQGLSSKIKQTIHLTQLELGMLNSATPSAETPVTLKATLGKYSKVELQGKIRPFTPKINTDLTFNVKELDLYTFSPLIKETLGYRIQSGALTLGSQIHIKEDILKSKNHVILKGFELEKRVEESASTTGSNGQDGQSSVSLTGSSASLALNLLRDNQGKIELDIPVEGDLSDPSFRLNKVIQVAVLNALQSGSKAMLIMTLQPYGAIYLAAEYAFKQAGAMTLQPISYEVGLNKIKPGMAEYLQKIVALLEDKKQVTLKVCGFYNQQDRNYWIQKGLKDQVLQDKLYTLAQTRQNQVKDWLVDQGKIDSDRLTTCHPSFKNLPETGVLLSM